MTDPGNSLLGARILVLEDDYYLASDLQDALESAGASVMGPYADEAQARLAVTKAPPNCALLDVNLGSGPTFELPRLLTELAIPYAFVTGYDRSAIPEEFAAAERFEKPVVARRLIKMTGELMQRRYKVALD